MSQLSNLENASYLEKLSIVARLSPLFSDSSTPFIQSRFAERIFCLESGAEDLARKDISFDAKTSQGQGVGIKTYVASNRDTAKVEKIAEFTSYATQGRFGDLSGEGLAREVSFLRNLRVRSDSAEIGISLDSSFYHCVVRTPGELFFIEQDYAPIEIENLVPTDNRGKPTGDYSKSGHVYFDDGNHGYMFNVAKNVLYRRFDPKIGFSSSPTKLAQHYDLSSLLNEIQKLNLDSLDSALEPKLETEVDYVVLPLYSPSSKTVAPASGINQWNAGGRVRKFSEAYIPVPALVHKLKPGFFPSRDVSFALKLPNGDVVQSSICQDGDKALMSNPNTELCKWLFATIDGSFSEAERRMASENLPYTYSDLLAIGKDSVIVRKVSNKPWDYELESAQVGSYENFVEEER